MANEEFTIEECKKIADLEKFLKEAFCIDGDCDYIEDVAVKGSLYNKDVAGMMFAMSDSKRGLFYVTLSNNPLINSKAFPLN